MSTKRKKPKLPKYACQMCEAMLVTAEEVKQHYIMEHETLPLLHCWHCDTYFDWSEEREFIYHGMVEHKITFLVSDDSFWDASVEAALGHGELRFSDTPFEYLIKDGRWQF